VTCQEQLQQLGRAMQMYTAASGGLLPDAAGWLDKLREFMPEAPSLHCPSDPKAGISYAYNANLEGKRQAEIASPATTPMVFASTLHGTNPADTGESWPDTVRHPDGNMVLFVDGTVRPVLRKPRFDVTLRPPQPPSARAPRAPSLRVPRQ
jgi:prepilin-type processing-associated H-X9-DG protein